MIEGGLVSQIGVIFGAGILAALSPCVYPMIPIAIGYFGSQAGIGFRGKILGYFFGQSLAYTALGVFVVLAGETLGFSSASPTFNLSIGIFLLVAGWVTLSERLPGLFSKWNQWAQKLGMGNSGKRGGMLAAFLFGVGSALVASPCTTPILSGVLALMADSTSVGRGIFLMTVYSLGFSSLFLAVGLGFLELRKLPRSGKWMVYLNRVAGALLIALGVYYVMQGWELALQY